MTDGFDNTWDQCAIQGCRGTREGCARFCPPCLRESIRSQEKYEYDAHKAISALFVRPDPEPEPEPAPLHEIEPGDRIVHAPAAAEVEADPGLLRRLAGMLGELLERQAADAFADAPEEDPATLEPPAPDEPPPADYRTPADGYGARVYRQGRQVALQQPLGRRELHTSAILQLGPMVVGIVTLQCPGTFACADIHGFRVWLPDARTMGECETVVLRSVQHWGRVVYGSFGGDIGGAPASHLLRLRDLVEGEAPIRLAHGNDILFQFQNVSQCDTFRLGVVLDLTGYQSDPDYRQGRLPGVR